MAAPMEPHGKDVGPIDDEAPPHDATSSFWSNPLQGPNSLPKKAFSELFKEKRKQSKTFSLRHWKEEERTLNFEEDVRDLGPCLVGFILGRFPGLKEIEKVRDSWQVQHTFAMHESGWMVFRFKNELDCNKVLEGGPYETFEDTWLLKPMPPLFAFDDTCFGTIPTWVRLPGLPLQLWSEVALGKLLSNVGIPLAVDECTCNMERISFVRALVEVDATKPLVRELDIPFPNGVEYHQEVLYERAPIYCTKCKRIGHDNEHCRGRTLVKKGSKVGAVSWLNRGDQNAILAHGLATQQAKEGVQGGPNVQSKGVKYNEPPKAGNLAKKPKSRSASRPRHESRASEGQKIQGQGPQASNEEGFKGQNRGNMQVEGGQHHSPENSATISPPDFFSHDVFPRLKASDKGKGLIHFNDGQNEAFSSPFQLPKDAHASLITKEPERSEDGTTKSLSSFVQAMANESELEDMATLSTIVKKLSRSQRKKESKKRKKAVEEQRRKVEEATKGEGAEEAVSH